MINIIFVFETSTKQTVIYIVDRQYIIKTFNVNSTRHRGL
ncbi:hypothetical protein FDI40_gp508 [Agrobacterium phage Atu_ph07]|uniref:Uncharacterized protein n=1 Tax=Agrobacterium phage Atu_ph07 TaxID=2024264 RepID=A0A2L0V0F7_9CAUD|nr:hypothetical protein FDI40_gp508 [Agrobacterium phage Atu_ph07]AUZ95267.1 hypothetical protein [Agrobacterium phage Atu_ph07]